MINSHNIKALLLPQSNSFDPYHILEISPNATQAEIKQAYVRLSKKYHPDKNSDTAHQFIEINTAYNMLMAERRRQSNNHQYDSQNNLINSNESSPESFLELTENPESQDESDLDLSERPLSPSQVSSIKQMINNLDLAELKKYINEELQSEKSFVAQNYFDKNDLIDHILSDDKKFYYTDNFSHLTFNQLQEKIQGLKEKYSNIANAISEQAFLWVAEKPGFAPIYIFNAVHCLIGADIEDIFLGPLSNVIDKVQIVFNEIDINFELDKKEFQSEILYFIDLMIAKKAHEMGKKLQRLESYEVVAMLGMNNEYIKSLYKKLEEDLSNPNSTLLSMLKNFTHNYLTHIAQLNASDLESNKLRNIFWMGSILPNSAAQMTSLVVCGASHSLGQYGLPNLLAHEGFTLTPLMTKAPTAKSVLLKELYSGILFTTFSNKFALPNKPIQLVKETTATVIQQRRENLHRA